MHRSVALLTALAVTAILPPVAAAGTASPAGRAAGCNFEGAKHYDRFGGIKVFRAGGALFGCATDVGRAYRLARGKNPARSTVFGHGDWVGVAATDSRGRRLARAVDVRSGRTHRTRTKGRPTALVVNADGTLAWIAGTSLWSKRSNGRAKRIGSAAGIDRGFLGLELEGCAVTWKVDGVQRSSGIWCAKP